MKKAHYIATIPAGSFHVIADTVNGKKLDYSDAWDRMILYRYFNPDQIAVTRHSAKDIKTLAKGLPVTTFSGLQKYGTWR